MTQELREAITAAAAAIRAAKHVIAITGAGASVESGIPDFRSPGGIWEKYPPEDFATIHAFQRDPDRVWTMWYELAAMVGAVAPNPGHLALARLEALGRLDAIITQNIDNLHQTAGCTNVIEYHGNAAKMVCMRCAAIAPLNLGQTQQGAPRCGCGGVMKPDVVLFGEDIPRQALKDSERLAMRCDLMLVIGTSASVYPAAGLPFLAKEFGAVIIECNLMRTEFTGTITDHFLEGPAGVMLPALIDALAT